MDDQFSEVKRDDWLSDHDFEQLSGVTFAYAMDTIEREMMLCHYVLTPVISSSPKDAPRDTRGYREMSRRYGKQVPPTKAGALRYQLFVLPGAEMSPADIVKALRAFIVQIEKHGMFVGKYKDAYIKERMVKKRVEEG